MEGLVTLGLLTELAVQRFGRADLFWAWAGANRHVPRDLASSNDRRGIGAHPVIPAVFAPVLTKAVQDLPAFNVFHMSAKAWRGMSGWRTTLCISPAISSRSNPLT